MTEHLPFRHFEGVDPYSVAIDDIRDDDEFAYIFEVDLHYPRELFEMRKDLSLCSEHREVPASHNKIENY